MRAQLARPAGRAHRAGAGPRVRRHGDRRPGHGVPARAPRRPAAVLPRGRAVRAPTAASTTTRAYADESLFPPAFRDRPGGSEPRGDCGLVDCRDLTVGGPAGVRRPAGRQPAQPATAAAPRSGTRAARPRRRRGADATCATGPGWRSRSTGWCCGSCGTVDDNTYVVLTSDNGFHLGQLGLLRGKGTRLRHRHPRAAARRRPRRRCRGRATRWSATSTWRRRSRTLAGLRLARLPLGHLARADAARPGGAAAGLRVLRAHLLQDAARQRPRPAVHRGWAQRHPVLRRRPQPHRAAGPQRPRPRAGAGTDYAYEFYDYRRASHGSGPTSSTTRTYAAESATLMAKLDEFDALRAAAATGARRCPTVRCPDAWSRR